MICRIWHGWTTLENAGTYEAYLTLELFPRIEHELKDYGYCGYHLLKLKGEAAVEFVTMVWFDSLEAVRFFAGEAYEKPVISPKAEALLSHYAERCDHYDLASFQWPWPGLDAT